MNKNRIEAFSDAVIAIIITIMVLEMKVPHTTHFSSLISLLPVFLCYLLSFIYVGIYWNNHHHLFHAVKQVNGMILWANLHLLFWLSLLPFVTGWMGENHYAMSPVILYGIVLLMAATAYYILVWTLTRHPDHNQDVQKALGHKRKEFASMALYGLGIGLACLEPLLGIILYAVVAAIWLRPDRRIEKLVSDGN